MLLCSGPEPIGGAVDDPARLLMIEGNANAEHALLTLPARKEPRQLGALDREAPHDGEAIRMALGRFQRMIVVVARPGRRNDDGAVDASLVHHREKLLIGERLGQMRPLLAARDPRTLRRLGCPEMDL